MGMPLDLPGTHAAERRPDAWPLSGPSRPSADLLRRVWGKASNKRLVWIPTPVPSSSIGVAGQPAAPALAAVNPQGVTRATTHQMLERLRLILISA